MYWPRTAFVSNGKPAMSFFKSDLFRSFFVGFGVTAVALVSGALPLFGEVTLL